MKNTGYEKTGTGGWRVLFRRPAQRPITVWLLGYIILGFGLLNLARLIQAVQEWEFLEARLAVHPAYFAISGAVWAGAGFVVSLLVMKGFPLGRRLAIVLIPVYAIAAWIERITLPAQPERGSNTPFMVGLTLCMLGLCGWILLRNRTRTFFNQS